MSERETNDLVLQYMQVVVRQQEGILDAFSTMQRQNDNLSAILSQELRRRNEGSTTSNYTTRGTSLGRLNRPRARTFYSSRLNPIRNMPRFSEEAPRAIPTPRIVTHHTNRSMSVNIPGSISESTNTVDEDILNATMNDSPIRIRPSVSQIRRATRLLQFRDISNTTQTICPIDREDLNPEDYILQILHCNHCFREANLRRHFRNFTRCPLCRFDIRDHIPSLDEPTFRFPNTSWSRPRLPPPPPPGPPPPREPLPPLDLEDPFETRPSENINPIHQSSHEIQSLLDTAITNAISNTDTSGNIVEFQYSVSLGSRETSNA